MIITLTDATLSVFYGDDQLIGIKHGLETLKTRSQKNHVGSTNVNISTPAWATHATILLVGGGGGGHDSFGVLHGDGGFGGDVNIWSIPITTRGQVTGTLGAGGVRGDNGQASTLTYQGVTYTVAGGQSGANDNQDGTRNGWYADSLSDQLKTELQLTVSDFDDNDYYSPSEYGTGNAGNGFQGGGAAGGDWRLIGTNQGGRGGDGYAEIVFWSLRP